MEPSFIRKQRWETILVQGVVGLPDVLSPLDGKQDQGVPGYPRVQLAVTGNFQDPLGFLLVEVHSKRDSNQLITGGTLAAIKNLIHKGLVHPGILHNLGTFQALLCQKLHQVFGEVRLQHVL